MHYTLLDSLEYSIGESGIHELFHGKGAAKASLITPFPKVKALQKMLLEEKNAGMLPSPTIGDIYQDFSQKLSFKEKKLIDDLKERLASIVLEQVYKRYGFQSAERLTFDSVIMQHYPLTEAVKPFAIPPHQDHRGFVEIVAILLIEGGSYFYVADDRHQKGELYINAKPMDLILMRGYNFAGRGDVRPVHYVKKVKSASGRTSLTFRVLSKDKEHLATLQKTFGTEL